MAYKAYVSAGMVGMLGIDAEGNFRVSLPFNACVQDNESNVRPVDFGALAGQYNFSDVIIIPYAFLPSAITLRMAIEAKVRAAYSVSIVSFVYPTLWVGLL